MLTNRDQIWVKLREFCEANPYITFDKLEIKNGAPDIGIIAQPITPVTTTFISVRFRGNKEGQNI